MGYSQSFFFLLLTNYLNFNSRISNQLNQMLLDDGWIDKVKQLTRDEMERSDSTNFVDILNKVEPQALDMVNDKTRTEILQTIKEFLNDIVEV
ncbi:Sus1 [Kluyveromyces lactis]|nr:Sus1 [Kluyveromyces lactis]